MATLHLSQQSLVPILNIFAQACHHCYKTNSRWHCVTVKSIPGGCRLLSKAHAEVFLLSLAQIDSFELLYHYDEHLGHLMWYVFDLGCQREII